MSRAELAAMIDHTLLKPEATAEQIRAFCAEAVELGVWSVCVSPIWVAEAKEALADTPVRITTVVGFPAGASRSDVKAFETAHAVEDGADEIDMVIHVGAAKMLDFDAVRADIATVRAACAGLTLKVILETAALTPLEVEHCCVAAMEAGADFVKTSTGFHPTGGASLAAVSEMAAIVNGELGVKASGGIRTATDALLMVSAGATRLGLSATRAILDGLDDIDVTAPAAPATGGDSAGAGY